MVEQVLSWDIRSVSQRNRPHDNKIGNGDTCGITSDLDDSQDGEASGSGHGSEVGASEEIMYRLSLDGMDFSYKIDYRGIVIVEKVQLSSKIPFGDRKRCSYLIWKNKLK